MKRSVCQIAVLVVVLLLGCSGAWADSAVSVTGTVWQVAGNLVNAPTSDPSGTLLGTFTAGAVDFYAGGGQGSGVTLGDFLAYGSAQDVTIASSSLSSVMSNCFSGTGSGCYSTVIKIQGTATFLAGTTYTLTHDDGAVMYVGSNVVINSAGPTTALGSTWTPGSTVTSPFTIYYSATNGNPEQLRLEGAVGAVPDGGMTLMLLGGVLVGIETLRRKFRA